MNRVDAFFTTQADSELVVDTLRSVGWLRLGTSILEPAVGSGSLIKPLKDYTDNILTYDIRDYGFKGTIVKNFLEVEPQRVDLVVGNPPFGRNATLATRFFNQCTLWSDKIAFIVPKSFRKSSIMDRLDSNFWPVLDVDLTSSLFLDYDNGKERFIPCCLQLWDRRDYVRKKTYEVVDTNQFFTILTKEQALETPGSYALRGQGSAAGHILEGLDHSPASTRFLVGNKELLGSINFSILAKQTAATPAIGFKEIGLGLMIQRDYPSLLDTYLTYGIVKLISKNYNIKKLFLRPLDRSVKNLLY